MLHSSSPAAHRALTLIELLVVVLIIAILAAIALPSFFQAQTRSKVAHVKSDLRALAAPLEAYYVDYNRYPQNRNDDNPHGLSLLSSPIAYISDGLIHDPFLGSEARIVPTGSGGTIRVTGEYRLAYLYSLRGVDTAGVSDAGISGTRPGQLSRWWVLRSLGPDGDADAFGTQVRDDETPQVVDSVYDPTNGTSSSGNLYRLGGTAPEKRTGRVLAGLAAR